MSNFIPEATINEIKNQVNIVDVIGEYVNLTKRGKNYIGLCPFHEEKTPSFNVSEEKGFYHCFSCGRSGNVFGFVMEIEHLNFPEAVRKIASRTTIEINQPTNSSNSKFQILYKIHQVATEFYHHLLTKTEVGQPALDYLKERQITKESIADFDLGFVPDEKRLLYDVLTAQDFTDEQLKESGLFWEDEQGQLFDLFVNRVMFPLKNETGQVIGFSGRKFAETETKSPKYLNSPETQIFKKNQILFNLDQAKVTSRLTKNLILFEGYMDVIAATQAGVLQGIASMGTSLTQEQVYTIKRIAPTVIISYDGDEAGVKATSRAISLIQTNSPDLQIEIASMPELLDPDEYIKKYGADKFQTILKNAISPVDYLLDQLQKDYNLNNNLDKSEFAKKSIAIVAQLPSSLDQEIYLNQLAKTLEVSTDSLKAQLKREVRQQNSIKQKTGYQKQNTNPVPTFENAANNPVKKTAIYKAQERLLELAFHYDEVYQEILTRQIHFPDENFANLFDLWQNYISTNDMIDVNNFIDELPPELVKIVVELEMKDDPEDYTSQELDDYFAQIKRGDQKDTIESLKRELDAAKRMGDQDLISLLNQKIISILRAAKD